MRKNNQEVKLHYKMYKSKKLWLFAGVGALMLSWSVQQAPANSVHADPVDGVVATVAGDNSQPDTAGDSAAGSASASTTTPTVTGPTTEAVGTTEAAQSQPGDDAQTTTATATGSQTTTSTDQSATDAARISPAPAPAPSPEPVPSPDPDPSGTPTLTNVVQGQDSPNISKNNQLQETYSHPALNQVNNSGNSWQGPAKAAAIPADAKGVDPATGKYYIDEWMPDLAFQYVLWHTAYQSQFPGNADLSSFQYGSFRNNFTKADLASLTELNGSSEAQNSGTQSNPRPSTYYQALMSMGSMEGLQYATNLKVISFTPNIAVSTVAYGNPTKNGNLFDISALTNLDKLQSVTLQDFSINDITALANKPALTTLNLAYNQVTDISGLASDSALNVANAGLGFQHVLLPPITLRDDTVSYQTPSFIIKDVTAHNLPISAYNGSNSGQSSYYSALYPSTADGGNVDPQTLAWSKLFPDSTDNYGSFSTLWNDPNSSFNGWILQPYALAADVGNVFVNYAMLQADSQGHTVQLTLAPTTTLSGTVGDSFDLNDDNVVGQMLQSIAARGYSFAGVILDGSGKYSDYIAGNGLAHSLSIPAGTTGTYTDTAQQRTLLFVKGTLAVVDIYDDDAEINADKPFARVTAANDLRLAGTPGTVSTYDDKALLDDFLANPDPSAKKYRLISDGTKSDGTSKIIFPDQGVATYEIHLGHAHEVTSQHTVTETITYDGLPPEKTPEPHVASKTFITVTDQVDHTEKQYVADTAIVDSPTLTEDGLPDSSWQTYDPAAGTSFAAVPNPTVAGYSVKSITPTQEDKSQIKAVSPVTPTTESLAFTVTYEPDSGSVVTPEAATLTLKYVDINGKSLQPDTVLHGYAENSYKVTPPAIDGHVFVQAQLPDGSWRRTVPVTDSLTAGNQTTTLVYQPLANQTETGHPYQQQGMVSVPKAGTLTVRYVDLAGNELKPSESLKAFVGNGYSVAAPAIAGHVYVQAQLPNGDWIRQNPASGTIKQAAETLTLVYQPLTNQTQTGQPYQQQGMVPDAQAATLTIRYVDINGKSLQPNDSLHGFVGNGYSVVAPAIKGHVYVQAQLPNGKWDRENPVVGKINQGAETLTLLYQPLTNSTIPAQPSQPEGLVPTPQAATMTIRYVDITGKPIKAEEQLNGFVGNGYSITPPAINGHVYVQAQLPNGKWQRAVPVAGILTPGVQVLTLVYQPLSNSMAVQPIQPSQPSEPTQPAQPEGKPSEQPLTTPQKAQQPVTTPAPLAKRREAKAKLPKTGESSNGLLSLAGLALLGLFATPFAGSRKRQ